MQPKTTNTRRIRQVSVTNLFGIFNHTIPLKMDEHITIIHGPNGFGKTMMFRLLRALFGQSNRLLQNIPFDELRIDFEDDTSFWVSKVPRSRNSTSNGHSIDYEVVFHVSGREPYTLPSQILYTVSVLRRSLVGEIERIIKTLDRTGPDAWRNMLTGETLSFEDVVERFGDSLPAELTELRISMPEWLIDMRISVPVHFVETHRLLRASRSAQSSEDEVVRAEYAVSEDSKHIIEVIRRKLAGFATSSQALDRTFPARLINPTTQQLQVTKDELLEKLQKLEEKRSHLMTIGLLDQETETEAPIAADQGIEDTTRAALAVYADDTQRKLGFFDGLARKIDLFTSIVNNRFLYKTLTISKEKGFVFTAEDGTNLPLEDLSSGEQHELVLVYELLFRTAPSSLILIDEPELSLHVVWQEQFLKDIQQITKLTNIDIIMATHSPDIINDRRDLLVELEGPEGD